MPKEYQHSLWNSIRLGNEKAFRQLFDEYWEALYCYACKITRDHSLAQDIVQGLFIHLWEKHSSLPEVKVVLPYLHSALKNRLLNALRDENLYQRHVDIFKETNKENDHSAVEHLQFKETERLLHQSINQLPGKMKDVFYLHRIENLSVAEIALLQGTSPQTIRNQLNTALQKIKSFWVIEILIVLWLL
ncbi:RNA polymerase sigma factor [Chitinophaga sp. CF118]|uniref:RNA polymerase sigma factor n=1 Tax=Chitinophaga sp. CF118 TaxID=1884367 RepID=UPI000B7DBDCA|nr:RNA polymerase sigma-70 factor [Chitinophaga sp. CF118]